MSWYCPLQQTSCPMQTTNKLSYCYTKTPVIALQPSSVAHVHWRIYVATDMQGQHVEDSKGVSSQLQRLPICSDSKLHSCPFSCSLQTRLPYASRAAACTVAAALPLRFLLKYRFACTRLINIVCDMWTIELRLITLGWSFDCIFECSLCHSNQQCSPDGNSNV